MGSPDLLWQLFYIILGIILLTFGGDLVVRGSVTLAIKLGISKVLVGMIVVGFGTSAPELLVSISATLSGSPDIAVGNVVGSNIANFLLILGLAIIITPVFCKDPAIKRDSGAVIISAIILLIFAQDGIISTAEGGIMLAILLSYLGYCIALSRRPQTAGGDRSEAPDSAEASTYTHEADEFNLDQSVLAGLMLSAVGIIMLLAGADFLVGGASAMARSIGISEAVIGLTLVAVGTSLPELAAMIPAALKRHDDVIIGNIMGSTLFNILSILGITALITPLNVAPQIIAMDIPISLAIVALTGGAIMVLSRLPRFLGGVMLAAYGGYLIWLFTTGSIAG
ncbi:MAG TPA: sodium:calcium antiporter [Alphaproteobacteria bacterium]|nr:sodium:calcium antiporter [Alphaproteobacteria bacterium]